MKQGPSVILTPLSLFRLPGYAPATKCVVLSDEHLEPNLHDGVYGRRLKAENTWGHAQRSFEAQVH